MANASAPGKRPTYWTPLRPVFNNPLKRQDHRHTAYFGSVVKSKSYVKVKDCNSQLPLRPNFCRKHDVLPDNLSGSILASEHQEEMRALLNFEPISQAFKW